MKKVSNKRIADAFRRAVPNLAAGPLSCRRTGSKNEYICHAIADTNGNIDYDASRAARSIICERIAPWTTLDSWLQQQGCYVGASGSRKIQRHRHAWLQMLIKEFENKK